MGGERKKFKKGGQQIKDVVEAIYLPQWITNWGWLWAGTLGNGIKHISELFHPRAKGAEVSRHHVHSVIAWLLMGGGEINFLTHSACYEVGRRALISSRNKLFHTKKCGGKSWRVPWNGRVPGILVGSWRYLLYPPAFLAWIQAHGWVSWALVFAHKGYNSNGHCSLS